MKIAFFQRKTSKIKKKIIYLYFNILRSNDLTNSRKYAGFDNVENSPQVENPNNFTESKLGDTYNHQSGFGKSTKIGINKLNKIYPKIH
jgi:hypothetical protein